MGGLAHCWVQVISCEDWGEAGDDAGRVSVVRPGARSSDWWSCSVILIGVDEGR